jgi:F0F1-type ATP synthase assembly protein I
VRAVAKPGTSKQKVGKEERGEGAFVEKSMRSFQDTVQKSGPAASASYTLIGAIILLGGIGYAVDEWRGTSPWFLVGGLLFGLIVGFYELAKTVWRK